MFRGSTFRDGNTREVGPSGNGTLWRFLLRDRSFAPPSVHPDGSIIYVGGKQGLAQHLVDDDQFADVNFIELRGREGAGPLTSI